MIIGLLQLNPTVGAFAANREKRPAASLTKPPGAELRPQETLDAILDLHVVKNPGKAELVSRGFAAAVNDRVNKVTFSGIQSPPGLKVSPRAFGTGSRIPVAQQFRVAA